MAKKILKTRARKISGKSKKVVHKKHQNTVRKLHVKQQVKKDTKAKPIKNTRVKLAKAEPVQMFTIPDNTAQVEQVLTQPYFLSYMTKNVGSPSIDILKMLVKNTQTDEGIAAKLEIKINEVRRMLNIMNGYSFLRYDTNKDNKGWLIFKWRIDRERLFEFDESINKSVIDIGVSGSSEGCNDFFFCVGCYESNKVVVPFDAAFETNFKCNSCGKAMDMLSKEKTAALLVKKQP